jgi:hypothetical protein
MDHPYPWLRYLPAEECADATVEFDGFDVEGAAGDHLGNVDGFIVDADSNRPYYVVVDAGGWFKSKHFLLPVGHARLDSTREVLVADLTRERVDAFPGFDKDAFAALTSEELQRLHDDMCRACEISDVQSAAPITAVRSEVRDRPQYRYPDWWRGGSSHAGRTRPGKDG